MQLNTTEMSFYGLRQRLEMVFKLRHAPWSGLVFSLGRHFGGHQQMLQIGGDRRSIRIPQSCELFKDDIQEAGKQATTSD